MARRIDVAEELAYRYRADEGVFDEYEDDDDEDDDEEDDMPAELEVPDGVAE